MDYGFWFVTTSCNKSGTLALLYFVAAGISPASFMHPSSGNLCLGLRSVACVCLPHCYAFDLYAQHWEVLSAIVSERQRNTVLQLIN